MAFDDVLSGSQAIAESVQQFVDCFNGVSGGAQPILLTSLSGSSFALTIRQLSGNHFRIVKGSDAGVTLFEVTDTGIVIPTLEVSSTLGFPAGTVLLPGLFLADDANTGLYGTGVADQLGITTAGTKRALFDADGDIALGYTSGNAEILFVDRANGRVGIMDTTPSVALDVTGAINATGNLTIGGTGAFTSTLAAAGITTSAGLTVSGGSVSLPTGSIASAALVDVLSGKTLTLPKINDTSANHTYTFAVSELAADRTVTLPLLGGNDTFVFADFAQTLTNKTLTSPIIATISNTGLLTLPTSTDTLVGRATTDTLTNKTLTSPVLTTPSINDTSANHTYNVAVSELAANRTITLPLLTGNDTFVFADFTQTLTNKTLTSPTITTLAVSSGGAAVTGDSSVTGDLAVSGDLAVDTDTLYVDAANDRVGVDTNSWDADDTTNSVKLKVAGGIRFTSGALVFQDGSTQTAAAASGTSMTGTGDITIGSDTDSSGGGDILFQTRGSTKVKIPTLATAGGVLELVQAATPAAPSSGSSRLYVGTDDQAYAINSGGNAGLLAALGYDNPIINGDFNVWQRGTSFAAVSSGAYTADRWLYANASAAVHTLSRSTDVPSASGIHPFQNYSLLVDCTTADASIATGDIATIQHRLEGYSLLPIAQRVFTISFWVKATKTGVYCVSFNNVGGNRTYVAEYTVNVTNTWEYKTITVPASPSAGTWDYTTGIGMYISWALAAGATYQTTAGTWQTGNFYATSNQVNALDSTSNDFRLSQVRITPGGIAAPFAPRSIGLETDLCRRYFERISSGTAQSSFAAGFANNTTAATLHLSYYRKRVAPTSISFTALGTWGIVYQSTITAVSSLSGDLPSVDGCRLVAGTAAVLTAGNGVRLTDGGAGTAAVDLYSEL